MLGLEHEAKTIPSPEQAPYQWILSQGGEYHFVGKTGGQFVHYFDNERQEDVTLHIGATDAGEIICDARVKEYARPHIFIGSVALSEVPLDAMRQALRAAVGDNRFLFSEKRQRLIKSLAAHLPELKRTEIYLPEPVSPAEFADSPQAARICLKNLRFVLSPIFDNPRDV